MSRALFVSLRETYPQLSPQGRGQSAAALRNCTCVAWHVGERANGVEFLFGVERGCVVSAYKVTHPLQDWPRIPLGASGAGLRIVPVTELSTADWATALTWSHVPMAGRILYGEVQLDNEGRLSQRSFTNRPTEEELAEDEGT